MTYYGSYGVMLAVVLAGIALVVVAFTAGRLVAPSRPWYGGKLKTYECGIDPVGEGWAQTHVRYYVFVYLYVIFAVDAVYLFPWATVFDAPGYGVVTLVEMVLFIGFLATGILYAWRRGVLRWV